MVLLCRPKQYQENFDQDDIYIYGNFNDWQITSENKMTYNPDTGLYEATILFKQGFYNYMYGVKDGDTDAYLNFLPFGPPN